MQENGRLLCLQYKYGNKNNILSTYEECLELVKKYPIIFVVVPDKFKDKNMVMTYIKANGEYVKEYNRREKNIYKLMEEEEKNNCYSSHHENYSDLKNNAIVNGYVDFGEFTKDVDVITLSMQYYKDLVIYSDGFGGFDLTKDNYDEKVFVEAIKKEPMLIIKLFIYWEDKIKTEPKEQEKIKTKFELYNNPGNRELAMFKCVSLIDEENDAALAELWAIYCCDFDFEYNEDHIPIIKEYFSKLSNHQQNSLVNLFFYNVKYLKDGVIDSELEEFIAKKCPIAGDILSDKAILKYNLNQHITVKEAQNECKNCGRCQFGRIRFVH